MSKAQTVQEAIKAATVKGGSDAALGLDPMFTAARSRVSAAYLKAYRAAGALHTCKVCLQGVEEVTRDGRCGDCWIAEGEANRRAAAGTCATGCDARAVWAGFCSPCELTARAAQG